MHDHQIQLEHIQSQQQIVEFYKLQFFYLS